MSEYMLKDLAIVVDGLGEIHLGAFENNKKNFKMFKTGEIFRVKSGLKEFVWCEPYVDYDNSLYYYQIQGKNPNQKMFAHPMIIKGKEINPTLNWAHEEHDVILQIFNYYLLRDSNRRMAVERLLFAVLGCDHDRPLRDDGFNNDNRNRMVNEIDVLKLEKALNNAGRVNTIKR